MSQCANCGLEFQCGLSDSGNAACWCMQLPNHHALPASGDTSDQTGMSSCFCPACLKARLQSCREQQS